MADGEDYEGLDRFEDDYEGGRWIDGEFFYSRKKERPVQSKEDSLYGVFATGDSSDSDSDTGRRRRKRRRGDVIGSKGDMTKPVQFVSTGTVMPSKEIEENKEEQEEGNSSRGLGFGLGFSVGEKNEEGREDMVQGMYWSDIFLIEQDQYLQISWKCIFTTISYFSDNLIELVWLRWFFQVV
jgi:tuftelin-interacting protein 11